MEKRTIKKLLIIAVLGLVIGGLILVMMSILSNERSVWTLPAGLFCVVLGNLFNLIRINLLKEDEK